MYLMMPYILAMFQTPPHHCTPPEQEMRDNEAIIAMAVGAGTFRCDYQRICRRLGPQDAAARPWHTSIKSHRPPAGRFLTCFLSCAMMSPYRVPEASVWTEVGSIRERRIQEFGRNIRRYVQSPNDSMVRDSSSRPTPPMLSKKVNGYGAGKNFP